MTAYHQFHNGKFRVHERNRCLDQSTLPCPLHSPSDHEMADWPMEWQKVPGQVLRLCPHGFSHPDPDSMRRLHGGESCTADECELREHFCDGCCHPYIPVDEIIADLIAIAEAISGN